MLISFCSLDFIPFACILVLEWVDLLIMVVAFLACIITYILA